MAGQPGNPYHDPKTGRFTSSSGLNRNNSTISQRGKARVKEGVSNLGSIAAGAAGAAAAGVGMALLRGVTIPTQRVAHAYAQKGIQVASAHAERLVATHGPKIASAIAAKGSTIINHVKNMKSAAKIQHTPAAPKISKSVRVGPIGGPKPRVRVPMGRK